MGFNLFHTGISVSTRLSGWLIRNLVFPIWVRRDHPNFVRYFREFEKTQFLPKAELQALQLRRLRKILRYAHDHCPFYAQRIEAAGIVPENLKTLEDLSCLPVLTKRDIQDHRRLIESKGFPPHERVTNQTGGSTGSPLQFYVDRDRLDSRMASTYRHNRWAGMQCGNWQVSLWGSRLDQPHLGTAWDQLRNNLLHRTLSLNTSRVTDEDWSRFIAEIREKQPRIMVAYTQAAVLFARYVQLHDINDIKVDSIITTAEVLLPGQREIIEQAFGGKVFNRYGCREVSVIASECAFHRGMHVNTETLYVEIVSEPGSPLGRGRIIITDLLNRSMPLIRYEIGDIGQWAEDQNCPCGRHLPLLAEVQGRFTDFIILSDGTQISGPALTLIVSDMTDVRQVQFVQKSPQTIVLRVVPGLEYGPVTERELRRRFALYLNNETRLDVEIVDTIASEISGKYRFVIRDYDDPTDN